MAISLNYLPPVTLPQPGSAGGNTSSGPTSFGALFQQAVNQLEHSQNTADQAIVSALAGNTSLTEVMVAMARAQVSLDSAVAVQNQALSSYQTIMNMPLS
jgi:flagellar hook-basal body complex protein FliE